ncbi:hypothetical protein ILYODFUR_032450 [Ilyodon furcidens]|uniref:Matrix-remodeling-associated protein 7 helical domain-containing protein n=1 Tax=Ilyodon furcidens TaxID=33524 RepID=A0ABV0TZJ7_9TELE
MPPANCTANADSTGGSEERKIWCFPWLIYSFLHVFVDLTDLRVQQEQLEAIFLLLQQNRELLGSETLKDSEEQLNLSSTSETPTKMTSIHRPNI